jgi:hypothetical protein
MGKRSNFTRAPRDFYPTPAAAVRPLLAHLPPMTRFAEPCAGDGTLINHLAEAGHECVWASDIEPQREDIEKRDVMNIEDTKFADTFITNPPWSRGVLHALITHLSDLAPTWLLLDADWKHTRQAAPFMPRLRRIVSVGRVKWIEGSKHTGKENCAWHLFDRPRNAAPLFFGRSVV